MRPGADECARSRVADHVQFARYPTEFKGRAIQPIEGVSLRPVFTGRAVTRTQPIFWEHEGNRAVRSGTWKLVSTYQGAWELYDMAADRVERNNVAASIKTSSARSAQRRTPGPNAPTWIRGRDRL